MEINDLSKTITEQYALLQNFLDAVILQQKAIINNDLDELEHSMKLEGTLLISIKQKENQVTDIIGKLSDKYSLNLKSRKLSDFITAAKSIGETNLNLVSKLEDSLKKLILQIITTNNQNKLLVDQARNFVKGVIASFKSNNPVLDRKV